MLPLRVPRLAPPNISSLPHLANKSFGSIRSRQFHASPATMVQKVYFDVTWKGPKVDVDSKGTITKVHPGDVGECLKTS